MKYVAIGRFSVRIQLVHMLARPACLAHMGFAIHVHHQASVFDLNQWNTTGPMCLLCGASAVGALLWTVCGAGAA